MVGAAEATGTAVAADVGWQFKVDFVLLLIASLNIFVGVFNMLPLLPLDGGHIAFSIIEGIRGRAVGREVYERVSAIGIALVLLLFFVGLSNDVGRLGN